jgi:histidine triad (HIT) family protein
MTDSSNCLFCKIVAGKIPSTIVYQDEWLTAFRDIHPAAPTHVLIVPNQHYDTLNELQAADQALAGRLLLAVRDIAAAAGIAESGYKTVINTNRDGGQEVFHLHIHLVGGKPLRLVPQ